MFGLFKSNEEKKLAFFNKLRTETAIKLKNSFMNSVIISNGYNELVNEEFVGSKGKFGYDKTNPIPINGLDNLEAYFDKIRYKYASIDDINSYSFPSVSFQRTDENDVSKIGSSKNEKVSTKSLSIANIKGHIDVYNIFSFDNKKLAMLYINSYSLKTSNKIPEKFFHRDNVPVYKDGKLILAAVKSGKLKVS
tara:strand:- start:12 stop:590 length:579 start_codon:yes stop_codon:yes gene_type:complete